MKLIQLNCPGCGRPINAQFLVSNPLNRHFLQCEYCNSWMVCENEQSRTLSEFEKYLTSGIANITTGHYDWARDQFFEYAKWNPMDFRGWLGLWLINQTTYLGTEPPEQYKDELLKVSSGELRQALGDLSFASENNNRSLIEERARLVSEIEALRNQNYAIEEKQVLAANESQISLERRLKQIDEDYERDTNRTKDNSQVIYGQQSLDEYSSKLHKLNVTDTFLAIGALSLFILVCTICAASLGDGGIIIKIISVLIGLSIASAIAQKSKSIREERTFLKNSIKASKKQIHEGKKQIKHGLKDATEYRSRQIVDAQRSSQESYQSRLTAINREYDEFYKNRAAKENQLIERINKIDQYLNSISTAKGFDYYFSLIKS